MRADVHELADSSAAPADFFRRHGYLVIPQLIEPALAAFLWSYAHTKFASMLLNIGDAQVADTPNDYGDPAFDGLLEYLRPQIERISGLRLLPTYSFFRMYKRGDVLRRHRDRRACEVSVSVDVGQQPLDPWPLWVENQSGRYAASLQPGDALLYRGIDLFHWRDAFQGRVLVQAFLHYVDRDGPHADQKFDRRPTLMQKKEVPSSKRNNAETESAR
jgi:hypothetical protein